MTAAGSYRTLWQALPSRSSGLAVAGSILAMVQMTDAPYFLVAGEDPKGFLMPHYKVIACPSTYNASTVTQGFMRRRLAPPQSTLEVFGPLAATV